MEDSIYHFRKELQVLGYSKTIINSYPKHARNLLVYSKELYGKIKTNHIKDYYAYLKTRPNRKKDGNISETYLYAQMLGIKTYFEYLERNGKIKRNPYSLRLKQPIKSERTVFTQVQIKTLYQWCKGLQEKIIVHLCYGCGLRRSEAALLQTTDIRFEEKLLFVRKGKGEKRRAVPLTDLIAKDLQHYYSQTETYRNTSVFLINALGNALPANSIYDIFKRLIRRIPEIDEKEYCLHSLRHSIATHLLENEMSIEMVRDFLGHSQLLSTQIYTRINLYQLKTNKNE